MANEFQPTASCMWGIRPNFNVGDLGRQYQKPATAALNQVSATTRSAVLSLGVKSVSFQLAFQSAAVGCTINLYTSIGGVETLVWSSGPVNAASGDLYAGNFEFVDLQGSPIKVEAANVTGGWVTVTVVGND